MEVLRDLRERDLSASGKRRSGEAEKRRSGEVEKRRSGEAEKWSSEGECEAKGDGGSWEAGAVYFPGSGDTVPPIRS
jgi:hypothetical protein